MKPYIKHSEMYWRWVDPSSEELRHRCGDGVYLGEAGNSSYRIEDQTRFMRFGDEVLVQLSTVKNCVIIPADSGVKGLESIPHAPKNLSELIAGVEYDWLLRSM